MLNKKCGSFMLIQDESKNIVEVRKNVILKNDKQEELNTEKLIRVEFMAMPIDVIN